MLIMLLILLIGIKLEMSRLFWILWIITLLVKIGEEY